MLKSMISFSNQAETAIDAGVSIDNIVNMDSKAKLTKAWSIPEKEFEKEIEKISKEMTVEFKKISA